MIRYYHYGGVKLIWLYGQNLDAYDDYYGKEGFKQIHHYMVHEMDSRNNKYDMCMAGFILQNTLSENGGVTRGVCTVDADGYLSRITETFDIHREDQGICGNTKDGNVVQLEETQSVSMNMFGFPAEFIIELERRFVDFLSNIKPDDLSAEYLLPTIIDQCLRNDKGTVRVLETPDKWFGVTYKEDAPTVAAAIRKLVDDGEYPKLAL